MDGREIAGPSLERGVVFQSHALMPWLTVRQNIAFAVTVQMARMENTASQRACRKARRHGGLVASH
jgi:ABC-type taurine transport system ATPase subunit